MKRIIGVILGVLMCIGGFYCMLAPELTFGSLSTVFAITLLESAVAYFIIWLEMRKVGKKSGLLIVNAILALIGGIGLLTNVFAQIILEGMMLNMIAIFMTAGGISQIAHAFDIKRETPGKPWVWDLIAGILVVLSGIFSFINPLVLSIAIGINIAINIFTIGISLITVSLFVKIDEPKVKKEEIKQD